MQRSGDKTLVARLCEHAGDRAEAHAYTFLQDGETETTRWTYGALDLAVRRRAAALQERLGPGDRVVLQLPPGPEFLTTFLACLYAEAVAVPAPRDERPGHRRRVQAIAADCAASLTVAVTSAAGDGGVPVVAAADLDQGDPSRWLPVTPDPDRLAFLQYTSGSTGSPRGVMVTHANLAANSRAMARSARYGRDCLGLSWLPPFHDMGLIEGLLQPLFCGYPCVQMPPMAFLRRPRRWLRAISRYRATHSGGPNFAYELVLDREAGLEHEPELDLSCWRVAYDGAEPVRAETLRRFAERFAPRGFSAAALYPCYGLAEATLNVSGGPAGRGPVSLTVDSASLERGRVEEAPPACSGARVLAACGPAVDGAELAVVDVETHQPLAEGAVGEIWLAGETVATGYWERPEATRDTFQARLGGEGPGRFLRTGDLGFLWRGDLYVTGRIKDLLVVRGRNLHPEDLEWTAERAHPCVRRHGGAAFALTGEEEERVVLVQELERGHRERGPEVAEALRRAVVDEHGVEPWAVSLVRPGGVPRTTSGKVRRAACRDAWLAGELPVVAEWRAASTAAPPAGEEATPLAAWLARRLPSAVADPSLPLDRLGLDSLALTELAHHLERTTGLILTPEELATATVRDLETRRAEPLLPDEATAAPRTDPRAPFPAAAGAAALWMIERLAAVPGTFGLAVAARLPEPLPPERVEHAFLAVLERHPALTSVFEERDGEPWQRTGAAQGGWRLLPIDGRPRTWVDAQLAAAAREPFDLARGPLLRACLFHRGDGGSRLLLTAHHTVADFRSLGVVLGEIARTVAVGVEALAPVAAPHPAVAAGREAQRTEAGARASLEYWRGVLAGAPPVSGIDPDREPAAGRAPAGCRVHAWMSDDRWERVRAWATGRQATPFAGLLAGFHALLQRTGGSRDTVVAVPASTRERADLFAAVGFFVNPVAVRVRSRPGGTGAELLAATATALSGALAHRSLPFDRVVREVHPQRLPGRAPLAQTMLVLHGGSGPEDAAAAVLAFGPSGLCATLETLELQAEPVPPQAPLHDLVVHAVPVGDRLALAADFDRARFDPTRVRRLLDGWLRLLAHLANEPDRPVATLPALSQAERHAVLFEWSGAGGERVPDDLLHAGFLASARRVPDAVAVVTPEGEALSYGELDRRSRGLAARLAAHGAGPERPVAVRLERRPALLVALLGILRSGAPYVPVDPRHPEAHQRRVLTDAGAVLMVSGRSEPPIEGLTILDPAPVAAERAPAPAPPAPNHLAYVLYTSGSTGRPKGVAVPHRSAAALVRWAAGAWAGAAMDRVAATTSVGFDVSVFELYVPLAAGGTVLLLRDSLALAELTSAPTPTLAAAVPSAMAELCRRGLPGDLRVLALAGERLPRELADDLCRQLPAAEVWDLYGPTEHTVYSTRGRRRPGDVETIGRPLPGGRLHLLDGALRPVPPGAAGEIHLGGDRVARGYLRQPRQTAERFVPDPFPPRPGERLYRSGDRARHLTDGRLAYGGRLDRQLKVRGFRIEPEEVETLLAAAPGVREAAVAPHRGELAAFVALDPEASLDRVRQYLGDRLPGHMVPTFWHRVDRLPRTVSGKVERSALPDPRASGSSTAVAPRTPVETRLARLWKELLEVNDVGVHDDFFALGGHSLLALRCASRIEEELGVRLPAGALFDHPTIARLAAGPCAAPAEARAGGEAIAPAAPLAPRTVEHLSNAEVERLLAELEAAGGGGTP